MRSRAPLIACGLAIATHAANADAAYAVVNALRTSILQRALMRSSGDLAVNRLALRSLPATDQARWGLGALTGAGKPVPLPSELDHPDWVQTWYEVKRRRG